MKLSAQKQKYSSWQTVLLLFPLLIFIFISAGCDSKPSSDSANSIPELKVSISETIVPLFGMVSLPRSPSGIVNLPADNKVRRLYDLANTNFENMKYIMAVDTISQALNAYKTAYPEDKLGEALLYERLGAFSLKLDHTNVNNIDKTPEAIDKALSILKTIPQSETDQALCYYYLGQNRELLINPEEALVFYNKSIEILKSIHLENSKAIVLPYARIAAIQSTSNPTLALITLKSALKIVENQMGKNHPDVAKLFLDIGFAKKNQGHIKEALEYYGDALDCFDKTFGENSEESAEAHFLIADVYFDSASSDSDNESLRKAIDNYLKAYETFSKLPKHSFRASLIRDSLEEAVKLKDKQIIFSDWLNEMMNKQSTQ